MRDKYQADLAIHIEAAYFGERAHPFRSITPTCA
jgi:hypothetical protein